MSPAISTATWQRRPPSVAVAGERVFVDSGGFFALLAAEARRIDESLSLLDALAAGDDAIAKSAARHAAMLRRPDAPGAPRVLLSAPPALQKRDHCAPASLETLVRFYGKEGREDEIAKVVKTDGGTPISAVREHLTALGFTVCRATVELPALHAV